MVIPPRFHVPAHRSAKGRQGLVAPALVFQLGALVSVSQASAPVLPDLSEVAAEMQPLVNDGSYVGIVVGIVGEGGRRVFGFGKVRPGTSDKPSGETVFPLASITKTFTGDLLADFVLRGIALLGHALERAGGIPYEKLVQDRICKPLGMGSTRINPDGSMRRRMAQGYGKNAKPVALRKFDVGKSSGGRYSTADDMMTYLAANMRLVQTGIVPALLEAQEPRRRVPGKQDAFMGLTWHVRKVGSREFVSKNGGLAGFQSFAAFSRTDRVGIIALANSSPGNRKLDAASRRILRAIVFQGSRP